MINERDFRSRPESFDIKISISEPDGVPIVIFRDAHRDVTGTELLYPPPEVRTFIAGVEQIPFSGYTATDAFNYRPGGEAED